MLVSPRRSALVVKALGAPQDVRRGVSRRRTREVQVRTKSTARSQREEKHRGVCDVLISRLVPFAVRTHESNEFPKELQTELNLTKFRRESVSRMERDM
jgi:hypothetical protein